MKIKSIIAVGLALVAITSRPVACADGAEWGPAVSIDPGGINHVNTPALEGCPIESPDGRTLFFASNRAGGQGSIDIWVAFRDGPN